MSKITSQSRVNRVASEILAKAAHNDVDLSTPEDKGGESDLSLLDLAFATPIQARQYPAGMVRGNWVPDDAMVNAIHFGEKLLSLCKSINSATMEKLDGHLEMAGLVVPEGCTWGQEDPAVLAPGANATDEYPRTMRADTRHYLAAWCIGTMAAKYAALADNGLLVRDIADTTPRAKIVNSEYNSASPRKSKKARGK